MGETGCGKTRLIRFMCDLAAQGTGKGNMLIMKVRICTCIMPGPEKCLLQEQLEVIVWQLQMLHHPCMVC